MSFINFLVYGTGGNQQPHLRSRYPTPTYGINKTSRGYKGQDAEKISTTVIDSVLYIHNVKSDIRAEKQKLWKKT